MPYDTSLIPAIGISASGLDAQNRRMEVIANNVANANSTRGQDGRVFRRKEVIFAAKMQEAMGISATGSTKSGVKVDSIVEDDGALKRIYKPGHPDADADGFVLMPNVEPIEEMIDMMNATRAYEANLAAIKAAKSMASQALQIGR
jgi:flagellar basal-body rod protein FlgC